jgi:hypothetical protein
MMPDTFVQIVIPRLTDVHDIASTRTEKVDPAAGTDSVPCDQHTDPNGLRPVPNRQPTFAKMKRNRRTFE